MNRHAAFAIVVIGLLVARIGASQESDEARLVGTWRLVEFTDFRDGKTIHAFGAEPLGLFIYAPSGHMSIHIMRNPPPKHFDDLELPSDQQDELDVRSYAGYFGTYRVDSKRSVLIHQVEAGTLLGYIGTAQERPYRFEGDKLILGDDRTRRRVLVRVPDN
jgi:Lipocalin-like domain